MSEARPPKVLSCASCRQRKIKCDKVQPVCTQCSRVNLECVYPSRKPTRRVPRPRQSELLDRISRLENIVGQADPGKLQELDRTTRTGTSASRPKQGGIATKTAAAVTGDKTAPSDRSESPARDTTARYLSDEFWGNLCEEVEGIKHALDQPSDEDENGDGGDEQYEDSPETHDNAGLLSMGEPSGFVFGNPNYHERDQPSHPHPDMVLRLWGIYQRNVDPLIKILHRPTLDREIRTLASSPPPCHVPASKNALLFSISYAAAATLDQEASRKQFGERQDVLANRFRINAERALAAADYLNTNNLTTLQAITIYVTMLRCTSPGRASWVLTSMVIRLAQAMNLHRDGDGYRFSPFEAEMRRRLWYFIATLDIRGAEDRGSDAILTPTSYTTRRPTNIDDDDFGPDTEGPLKSKSTPADNVICVCTSRCATFGYIAHPHAKTTGEGSALHTEDELIQHVRALENDFIHTADLSHTASRYASEVARMVILKLWLIVQYPFSSQPTVSPLRVSRETMLRTAVSIMELNERMEGPPWKNRFAWWTRCYVQWHPLAVALAELCIQTEGELTERAWGVVDRVFPQVRDLVADSSKGPLWRPIRKLYKKAKHARAGSMMRDLRLDDHQQAQEDSQQLPLAADFQQYQANPDTMAISQPPVSSFTEPFDSINMDPSYLFQYPTELSHMNFDQPLCDMSLDMATWNEFLNDTQMDYSPEESGGDST